METQPHLRRAPTTGHPPSHPPTKRRPVIVCVVERGRRGTKARRTTTRAAPERSPPPGTVEPDHHLQETLKWLHSASEKLRKFSREAQLKKRGGLAPHPWAVAQPTGQSLKLGWEYGCVRGGGTPPPPPEGASNLQPVLHHADAVPARLRIGRQVIDCMSVSPISWQRNLNLCGSQ
jgi:hypothetical protein